MRIRNILRNCGFKFHRPTIVSIVGENSQGQIDVQMDAIVEIFADEVLGSIFESAIHEPTPGHDVLHVWQHTRIFGPEIRHEGEPVSNAVTIQVPCHAKLIQANAEYVVFYVPNRMILFSQKEGEIRHHRIGEARENMRSAQVQLLATFGH